MPVKYTNKHNLPESFVKAILNDEHVSLGEISVTQLIDSPQIRMLKKTSNYTMDVMDMVAMAFGTGVHTLLERGDIQGSKEAVIIQRAANVLKKHGKIKWSDALLDFISKVLKEQINNDIITEKTLTMEVLGWTISGTFDRYLALIKELQDYKTTSVSQTDPKNIKKWILQLNVYAVLLVKNGYPVESAKIIAILKDWSKMKINTSKDYPKTPVLMIDIPIIDHQKMIDYIEKRVALHQRAEAGEQVRCTDMDRWARAASFAVKKKGGKRALPNSIGLERSHAEFFIEDQKHKYKEGELYIEERKGESFRCANGYCSVSDFCPQYKQELQLAANEAEKI